MREVPFGQDGNFSTESMKNRINSELANNIGNLAQRTLAFIYKNANASVPNIDVNKLYQESLLEHLDSKIKTYIKSMESQKFNQALDIAIDIANEANAFIDNEAPWSLRKTNITRMEEVLYCLCESLRYIAIILTPFMPKSMDKLLDQLNVSKENRELKHLNQENALKINSPLPAPQGIFPRV